MHGRSVDSGNQFARREGEWWTSGADVFVAGAFAGEVMSDVKQIVRMPEVHQAIGVYIDFRIRILATLVHGMVRQLLLTPNWLVPSIRASDVIVNRVDFHLHPARTRATTHRPAFSE